MSDEAQRPRMDPPLKVFHNLTGAPPPKLSGTPALPEPARDQQGSAPSRRTRDRGTASPLGPAFGLGPLAIWSGEASHPERGAPDVLGICVVPVHATGTISSVLFTSAQRGARM